MAPPKKTTRHKSITRIDHPAKKTYGYFVRVCWKRTIKMKFFSDRKHGDRLAALDAAIEWRDRTERELGKPRSERMVVGAHARNTSGVVGVRRRKKGGSEVFEVTWTTEAGKIARTSYAIGKYGEKRAFRMAVSKRRLHERQRLLTPRVRRDDAPAPRPAVAWHEIR